MIASGNHSVVYGLCVGVGVANGQSIRLRTGVLSGTCVTDQYTCSLA